MPTFNIKLNDNFENTITRVTQVLQQEGFGILNEIHLDTVFKNKLNIDMLRYRILSACIPSIAHRLIYQHPDIGALFPCNVLVRVVKIGKKAKTQMMRVRDALESTS